MDVPGNDTFQHLEDGDSGPPTLTVTTAGVNEAVPLHNNRNSQNGECYEEEDCFPPSIMTPSQPVGGEPLEDSRLLVNEGSNNSSVADVEIFKGKIVYNRDGSAYLIEGVDSELSDNGYGGQDLFTFEKSNAWTSPLPAASRSSGDNRAPQAVNALHIARHTVCVGDVCGQTYGNLQRVKNHKVPEISVMHSYRVFTLKDKSGEDGTRFLSSDPKVASNLDTSSHSAVKSILMCFICKLSFRSTKSLVAHATVEHSLSLSDAEKELVSRKDISAVIQGVSDEPLISFLEPIPSTSVVASSSCSQKVSSDYCIGGGSASIVASSLSSSHGSVSSSSSYAVQTKDDSVASITATPVVVTTVVSTSMCPVTSVPDHAAAPSSEAATSSSSTLNSSTSTFGDTSSVPELEDLANIEKLAQAAAAAAVVSVPESSKSSPYPSVSNGILEMSSAASNSINESNTVCTPNSLPSIAKTASSINHHLQWQTNPIPHCKLGTQDDSINISTKSTASQSSANQSSSPIPVGTTPISISACVHHRDGYINGVECPKCDMILGSPKSLGGHMTKMSHWNSTKTLKCPKCNCYYKYKKSLEIHMKEKHPENEMICIYCFANQPHPRLARGKTYTCGYKPYRCEVCNYSTTTKGNLSIHMKSGKHNINVQELQKGSLTPEHIASLQQKSQQQQQQHIQTSRSPSAASLGVSSSNAASEALKKDQLPDSKQKASCRCDVCNYETNSARNLRIHMTSGKHSRNMMLLQQNMKYKQNLSVMMKALGMDRDKVNLMQHVNSLAHLTNENLRETQGESKPDMRDVFMVKECKQTSPESIKGIEEERKSKLRDAASETSLSNEEKFKDMNMFKNSNITMLKQALLDRSSQDSHESQQHTCPFCNFTSNNKVCIQRHIVSQHSQKAATLGCPLCEDAFREWDVLENHVMDTHHAKKECLNKLMDLVDETEWLAAQTNSNNSDKQSLECMVQGNSKSPKVVKNGPLAFNSCNPIDLSSKKSNDFDLEDPIEVKKELPNIDWRNYTSSDEISSHQFPIPLHADHNNIMQQALGLVPHVSLMQYQAPAFFCNRCGSMCSSREALMQHQQLYCLFAQAQLPYMLNSQSNASQTSIIPSSSHARNIDFPEINRSTCNKCGKGFSSISVLKAHQEETHKDIVSIKSFV